MSILPEPFFKFLFDLFVREGLACVRLRKALFNLGKKQEALHGIFNGGVFGKAANGADGFFFDGHIERIAGIAESVNYRLAFSLS